MNNNTELLFNADIEADVDRDGFGDETQDTCLTAGGNGSGCASATPAIVLSAGKTQRILKLSTSVTLDRIGIVQRPRGREVQGRSEAVHDQEQGVPRATITTRATS